MPNTATNHDKRLEVITLLKAEQKFVRGSVAKYSNVQL